MTKAFALNRFRLKLSMTLLFSLDIIPYAVEYKNSHTWTTFAFKVQKSKP